MVLGSLGQLDFFNSNYLLLFQLVVPIIYEENGVECLLCNGKRLYGNKAMAMSENTLIELLFPLSDWVCRTLKSLAHGPYTARNMAKRSGNFYDVD